jgi:phage shock protein PspC (stress-responsive transcriptional regulator)
MVRSFSNRIFGGVCGGLSSTTRLNAWIWRVIFVLLTLGTLGAGAVAYLILWWSLPQDSPIRRRYGGVVRGLLALLLSVGVIVAWFLRGRIFPAEAYWPFALFVLALVVLVKQIAAGRSGNIASGLVAVLVTGIFMLGTVQVLPAGPYDLALRSWPVVLVFLGLAIALRYRLPFGSWIALLASVVLVAGLATLAFNSRVDTKIDDNQIAVNETISSDITTLQVNVTTLDTDLIIQVADRPGVITGEFRGTNNSDLVLSYQEDGAIATFTLQEKTVNEFPLLEDIGRSNLELQISPEVAVAVAVSAESGAMTFDMASLHLERLNFMVTEGDVLVTLPIYNPLSPSVRENPGVWTIIEGDLRVLMPETVGARFLLDRSVNPEPIAGQSYDDLIYRVELAGSDFALISRRYDALNNQVEYRINLHNGTLDIDTESSGSQ